MLARILADLALAHDALGNHYIAIDLTYRALDLCESAGDRGGQAMAKRRLGGYYTALGDYKAAKEVLKEALALEWRPLERGQAIAARATIHDLEEEEPRALELFTQARALVAGDTTADPEARRRAEAAVLDRMASAWKGAKDLGKAEQYYRQAIDLYESLEDTALDRAVSLSNLARILQLQGRLTEAKATFERGLNLIEPARHTRDHALLRHFLALLEHQQGDDGPAAERFAGVLETFEELRDRSFSERLRGAFLDHFHPIYDDVIQFELDRHRDDPAGGHAERALAIVEQARARQLLDRLVAPPPTPGRTREPLEALESEINALESARLLLIQNGGPLQRAARLESEIRERLLEHDRLSEKLDLDPPPDGEPLDPSAIPALLDDETTLLIYSLRSGGANVWRVDRHGAVAHQLVAPVEWQDDSDEERRGFDGLARAVHDWLAAGGGPVQRSSTSPDLETLGKALLAPIAEDLTGSRLAIVADGAFHLVPFAALPHPGDGEPLVEHFEIVRLPSASVLAALRRREARRGSPPSETGGQLLVAVGDPVYDTDDPRLPTGTDAAPEAAFWQPRLEASGREIDAILGLMSPDQGRRITGFDATREMLLGGVLEPSRLVHLSVHAEANAAQPELSHLVLSLRDHTGQAIDGHLFLHEIDSLALDADLAVLAGCETALGKNSPAEGLLGLGHAVLAAGADRALVSLWKVDDIATAELMQRFYRRLLADGLPPGEALAAAQRELRRSSEWHDPYFWAGFVLLGDWRWPSDLAAGR